MSNDPSKNNNVLADKDVNAAMPQQQTDGAAEPKKQVQSMEYHRQMLASKMEQESSHPTVSPSDNIMSPCTAKLQAYRNKQLGNSSKPRSLFAQASSKKLANGGSGSGTARTLFGGAKATPTSTDD